MSTWGEAFLESAKFVGLLLLVLLVPVAYMAGIFFAPITTMISTVVLVFVYMVLSIRFGWY